MGVYLIMVASFGFIISLCQVLGLNRLIRLKEIKKLYPEATLKDIESFEKSTKANSFFKKSLRDKIEKN